VLFRAQGSGVSGAIRRASSVDSIGPYERRSPRPCRRSSSSVKTRCRSLDGGGRRPGLKVQRTPAPQAAADFGLYSSVRPRRFVVIAQAPCRAVRPGRVLQPTLSSPGILEDDHEAGGGRSPALRLADRGADIVSGDWQSLLFKRKRDSSSTILPSGPGAVNAEVDRVPDSDGAGDVSSGRTLCRGDANESRRLTPAQRQPIASLGDGPGPRFLRGLSTGIG